jgi:hypothetical protein
LWKELEMISINDLNPGAFSPVDQDRAIETYRALNSKEILPDPPDIEKRALDSGWNKEEARSLEKLHKLS